MESSEVSLLHALLAALPVQEAVTTNYDDLFEQALQAPRDSAPLAVLPYEAPTAASRWLLKLHGSIRRGHGRHADIVLSRDDYFRLARDRAALAGILQALLITRHLFFVGFSLSDDDFHQIAFDVRSALADARSQDRFGRVCLVTHEPLTEELWRQDLGFLDLTNGGEHTTPVAVRRLEIFMDYLAAEATTTVRHLFDDTLVDVLIVEEIELRTHLLALADASDAVKSSTAWEPVQRLLEEYGYLDPE